MRRRFMNKQYNGPAYLSSTEIASEKAGSVKLDKSYRYADMLLVGFGGNGGGGMNNTTGIAQGGGGSGSVAQVTRLDLRKIDYNEISYMSGSRLLTILCNGNSVVIDSGRAPVNETSGGDGGNTAAPAVMAALGGSANMKGVYCASNGGGTPGYSTSTLRMGGASGGTMSMPGKGDYNNDYPLVGCGWAINMDGPGGNPGGRSNIAPASSSWVAGKGYTSSAGDVEHIIKVSKFRTDNSDNAVNSVGGWGASGGSGYTHAGSGGGGAGLGRGDNGGHALGADTAVGSMPVGIGSGGGGASAGYDMASGYTGGNAGIFIYYYND